MELGTELAALEMAVWLRGMLRPGLISRSESMYLKRAMLVSIIPGCIVFGLVLYLDHASSKNQYDSDILEVL